MTALSLHPDRFFPADPATRKIARELFALVEHLPILSPHGHTDPKWFAADAPFEDATSLLLWPDHYVLRMLYSQGIAFEDLGIGDAAADRRKVWRLFGANYHLFRGTPSRLWLDHVFATVFGLTERLDARTADSYFDAIAAALATPAFRPRALFKRFNIEKLATTEGALDALGDHDVLARDWPGRVITTYRPDDVVDPDGANFTGNVESFGAVTGEATSTWQGYLAAHRIRRAYFRSRGATATDHGHPSAQSAELSAAEGQALLDRLLAGRREAGDAELFRAAMLTEMAKMSLEDGMTMQIHPGSFRNHNPQLFAQYGPNAGADIPVAMDYVRALKPLLDAVGNRADFTLILFTLDESTYARELAPLAGHYPCLKLGPAWWFHDSPEGMMRFRRMTTETAGFYNTAGFNDDTRAFLSIPARHDLARRIDAAWLAELVATHRLGEDEAQELVVALAYGLAKAAYKL
ncbi:MAG: glucuronate isomerase [Proteobacteria bacterium]|nr:glucuronate isomerase [Pseudomonadota bacterium]